MKDLILKCPFCGVQPIVRADGETCYCPTPRCLMSPGYSQIKEWNSRAEKSEINPYDIRGWVSMKTAVPPCDDIIGWSYSKFPDPTKKVAHYGKHVLVSNGEVVECATYTEHGDWMMCDNKLDEHDIKYWILMPAAPEVCATCKGRGSVYVGTSNSEADGNAAEFEKCDECGGAGKV